MPFLDFIHNRNATQQRSVADKPQAQKPETAKEMYSRQAAQQTANQKPLEQMPSDQRAKVEAIKERLENATRHIHKDPHAPAAAPTDSMDNREALRQNQTGQDKTAPALSPTDARTGRTAEGYAAVTPKESPAKTPGKSTVRPQTLLRPRPSWER
jgi:hypothetical protein